MRLLFPLDLYYPSKIGGPANTLYWLCKALVKNGHDVAVVATRKGIDNGRVELNKWIKVDGINTRYCGTTSKFPFSIIRHSVKRLRKVDTVVFSSICYVPNFIIGLIAKIQGKKIVWSPRGELFDSAVQGSKGKKLFFRLIRVLMGNSVLFHATSEVEKEAILNYFPKAKVAVIPNYMEIPTKEELESDYSTFIYVGRIAPIKALDKLIVGLSASKKFRTSCYTMKMVGGVEKQFEDYYQELNGQVESLGLKEKVKFAGSLTGKEKFQAYAAARYSFLVSNSENFGNVVIEALSQGTPVVTSKGTPWGSLPKVKAGFWIENTPEEIAQTVDAIIEQSDSDYLKYRENALNYSKTFDVYEHVDEWEKIL